MVNHMTGEGNKAEKPHVSPPGVFFESCGMLTLNEARKKDTHDMLRRYKSAKTSDQENRILAEAMKQYQLSAVDETDKRAFAVLLLSYFSDPTLTAFQISEQFHTNKRTVFKDISKGVEALSVLIFGIDAFTMSTEELPPALYDTICKCINSELREEVEKCLDLAK